MVLYYASEYSATNIPPKQLIDTNVSSDYKKIASLFTLKNKEQNFKILKEIIESIPQKTLITALNTHKNIFAFNPGFYSDNILSYILEQKHFIQLTVFIPHNYR